MDLFESGRTVLRICRALLSGHSFGRLILGAFLLQAAPAIVADPGGRAEEQLVTISGKLTTLISDDFDHGRAQRIHVLEDALSQRRYRLRVDGELPAHFVNNAVVTAQGRIEGDDLVLAAAGSGQSGGDSTSVTATAVSGEQATLVLAADFNDSSVSCSVDAVRDLVFTDPAGNSLDDLFRENSHGAFSLAGQVYGTYLVDDSLTSCDLYGWAQAMDAAALADGVNLGAYTHKVYVMPRNGCGASGVAEVGGSRAWVFVCDSPDLYAHEIGHNLGMQHASLPDSEYGDKSDFMGLRQNYLHQANAPHKEQMGWLSSLQSQTVTAAGFYDVAPLELDAASALAPQAVKIAKADTGDYYYISYRRPLGFDVNLSSTYLERLSVHSYAGDGSASNTYLHASLSAGESYVDAANGITIAASTRTDDYMTFEVRFDGEVVPPPTDDSEPPSTPTGLATSAKRKQVNLSWQASSDNVAIDAYEIWRNGALIAMTANTSYADRGISAGASYTYFVVAQDTAGNSSPPSDSVGVAWSGGGGGGGKGKGKNK